MPFTKIKNIDFKIQNNKIVLTDEYKATHSKKFKKITGSRFCNVLGLNPLSSSFKTWCQMVDIYYEPMDEIMANAGNIIEPKLRTWIEENSNYKFTFYDPKKCGFDVFKDNPIFGGIPDGEPLINGKIDYKDAPILEIKTTSIDSFLYKKIDYVFKLQYDDNNKPIIKLKNGKYEKWFDESKKIIIPTEYLFQLGLYCYLRNTNKGLFVICFLEYDDYFDPCKCDVNKRKIEVVEYEVDLQAFSTWINKAEQWYNNHILTGISPEMNNEDLEFVKGLLNE